MTTRPASIQDLVRMHEGKPPWFEYLANYALFVVRHRHSISLYGAQRWITAHSPLAPVYSDDIRHALRDFTAAGVCFRARHEHRIFVPDALRDFWREVLLPGFEAHAASLQSYVRHIESWTRSQLRQCPSLGAWTEESGNVRLLRQKVLQGMFSSASSLAKHVQYVAQQRSLPFADYPWPEDGIARLNPDVALQCAKALCLHPCYSIERGGLHLKWVQPVPLLLAAQPAAHDPWPLPRCLEGEIIHWQQHRQRQKKQQHEPGDETRYPTLVEGALQRLSALPQMRDLLRWWYAAAQHLGMEPPHGETLYRDASGQWHPLLIAQELLPELLAQACKLNALHLPGQDLHLTALGRLAATGERPPRALARCLWSRTSEKLTLQLDAAWPPAAQRILRPLADEHERIFTITPQSLRRSRLTQAEILARLGAFVPLTQAHHKRLAQWLDEPHFKGTAS